MNYVLETATATWVRNRGPALKAKEARMCYWLDEVWRISHDAEIRAEHPKLKAERIRFYMNPPPGCDASAKPSIHYIRKLVTIVRHYETTKNSSPIATKVRPIVSAPAPQMREPQVTGRAERAVNVPHNLDGFLDF